MSNNLQYRLTLKDFFRKTMLGAAQDTRKLDTGMDRLNRTINRAGGALAGYFAVDKLVQFSGRVIESTANMQAFQNSIRAASGSEIVGNKNLAFFNHQVDALGLNLQSAQMGYKTLTGAMIGTTLEGEKGNRIFRQLAGATTVLGLSGEQTEGALLAMGQMISKGTVQAEELRGQLAERIPGAFQIGARAMGVSTEQLGDMMKDGLIKADDFLVKFGNELEKTFGDKLADATGSVRANLNRISTDWERLHANIGESQSGLISSAIKGWSAVVHGMNEVIVAGNRMEQAFRKAEVTGFSFFEKMLGAAALAGNIQSGFVDKHLLGNMGKISALDAFTQKSITEKSSLSELSALQSKSEALQLRSAFHKMFASKSIGKDEYEKSLAIINLSLATVENNLKAFRVKPLPGTNQFGGGSKGASATKIGSATEVYGARPQNINIKLDRLGDIHINTTNVQESAEQVKEIFSKKMLEVLNDANLVADR